MHGKNVNSPAKENAKMLGILLLILLLLGALLVIPFVLGHYFGPLVGLLTALVAIPAWVYLGPHPMPGFVSGMICLFGFAALIGTLIARIVKVIHHAA
jgi:hypothetical protein